MRRAKLSQFKGGWWMGAFKPSCLPTRLFEVAHKWHRKGEVWPAHYQRQAVEYNLLICGRLQIGRHRFAAGDIFVIHPLEVVAPIFLTDCELTVVKVPSLPGDKVLC